VEYAGFWNRAIALLIDSVQLAIVSIIVNILLNENAAGFIGTLVGWLYFTGMESSGR
jgi:uncharacterized RDD family membrane protein YckC